MSVPGTEDDLRCVDEVLQRIASDLSMIADRNIQMNADSLEVERLAERAVGAGQVHVSFKLGFQKSGASSHGCLLIPLPDAISLASYMMMVDDEGVRAKREIDTLDDLTKDAMMEVGNFVGGAADAALRTCGMGGWSVSSEGCQGVRQDVRPVLTYQEGEQLLVGRASLTLHDFPPFGVILMLPGEL